MRIHDFLSLFKARWSGFLNIPDDGFSCRTVNVNLKSEIAAVRRVKGENIMQGFNASPPSSVQWTRVVLFAVSLVSQKT